MWEQPVDPSDVPDQEEFERERGELRLPTIEYPILRDAAWGDVESLLFPVNSPHRQQVAETIGTYFWKERRFDARPYSVGDDDEDHPVFLIRSDSVSMVPAIGGAAGFEKANKWVLTWIWIHPFQRGRRRVVGRVFDAFDDRFGEFWVLGPVSPAMKALMVKRNYAESRIRTRR